MMVETETLPTADEIFLNDVPLPEGATFFPLGFPLEIATNSEVVLRAARKSWGRFRMAYLDTPVTLRLTVTEGCGELPDQPRFRAHRHLMSIISDAQNQVICDFSRECAYGWVTRRVAESGEFFRFRFLDAVVMTMLAEAHLAPIHAALITKSGVGVMLCGESYAGKSTLAYSCARSGWTLVSDDGTFLIRKHEDRYAVGNSYGVRFREDAKVMFPELEKYRILLRPNGEPGMEVPTAELPISTAAGCSVDHVVFLRRSDSGAARINRFDAGEALAWLERAALYGREETRASQRQAYRRLLGADIWELHYSDLSGAEDLLGRLEGRA